MTDQRTPREVMAAWFSNEGISGGAPNRKVAELVATLTAAGYKIDLAGAVEAENEACAEEADNEWCRQRDMKYVDSGDVACEKIAAAIRARGKE